MEKAEQIKAKLHSTHPHKWNIPKPVMDAPKVDLHIGSTEMSSPPEYKLGDKVATRQAYGTALLKLAEANSRVIGLDGDVSNSTFSEKLKKKIPGQFVECFIAGQSRIAHV